MKIAYLVNQYPYVSSPFIRREIWGLEALGMEVARFSIRSPEIALVDQADQQESDKTRCILAAGSLRLIFSVFKVALTRPLRFLSAAWLDFRLMRNSNQVLRHLAYFVEACLLLEWVSKSKCSIVHAHFGTNATTVALLCRALGGPPYSFMVHGPLEFDAPLQNCLGEKVRHAAFATVISSFARSQVYRWSHPDDWSKIHEVHCCVEDSYLDAASQPIPDELRVVCVGGLGGEKGQLLLVEAAAKLRSEGLQYKTILVGDGPMRGTIETSVQRLGLKDHVEITGWVSGDEVKKEILNARLLVLPSFAEGLPVVFMEALALGRPVIGTYIAGIPELVVPGVCGWLVPAGSLDALVAAMREALETSPERLAEMGQAGVSLVRDRHKVSTEAEKLRQLFEASINTANDRLCG